MDRLRLFTGKRFMKRFCHGNKCQSKFGKLLRNLNGDHRCGLLEARFKLWSIITVQRLEYFECFLVLHKSHYILTPGLYLKIVNPVLEVPNQSLEVPNQGLESQKQADLFLPSLS